MLMFFFSLFFSLFCLFSFHYHFFKTSFFLLHISLFFLVFIFFSLYSFSLTIPTLCDVSRYQHYFTDAWNTFDALIVVGSVVDIAITEVNVSTLFFCLLSWTEVLLKSQMLINLSVLFLCWVLVLRVVSNIRAVGPTWPRSPMFLFNKCFTAES